MGRTHMKQQTFTLMQEFRDFALKGNVVDLAVGVVIGAAFGKIVDSLVGDMFMPLVGVLTGGIDFTQKALAVGSATIAYGKFIQTLIVFAVVALCLFVVVKVMNRMRRAPQPKPATPNPELETLQEIRDLLKSKS